MATNALNATQKFAIMALEASYLTADADAGDSTLTITGNYVTATPFTVGGIYTIIDNSAGSTNPLLRNSERFMVTDISGLTATPIGGGIIGYTVAGTLGILAESSYSGYILPLQRAYTMALGAKILTPGVMAAVTLTDFNCRFKTISDNPKIEFDDEASRYATGDEGRVDSISGMQTCEISFEQKLGRSSNSNTTMPVWGKVMEACGHVVQQYAAGIGFIPHSTANFITASIWVFYPDTQHSASSSVTIFRYSGAHGGNGCTIGASKIGDVYTMNIKMMARFSDSITNAYHPYATLSTTESKPEVMLSNTCSVPSAIGLGVVANSYASLAAIVTAFSLGVGSTFYIRTVGDTTDNALVGVKGSALVVGDSFKLLTGSTCSYTGRVKTVSISSWSIDMGGTVNPVYNQAESTGISHYETTDRDPKVSINPYMVKKLEDDVFDVAKLGITGELKILSQSTGIPNVTLLVPRAQLMSPTMAAREGLLSTNRTYRCLRNNNGVDTSSSLLPAYAMYEILIGARA